MTKLEEKRSSGFTITHEFKTELQAIKFVSNESSIVEKDVAECLRVNGWFDHRFENGVEVQYKLNP